MKNRYIPFGYQIQNGDSVINTEQAATVQHIGHQFTLDTTAGLERLVYLDDTAPYYIGEMATEWILPPVQREVSPWEPNPRP